MLYSVTIRATSFHIRLPILAAVLAALVLALAACGGGSEPTLPPASSEESTSVPAATPSSPAFTPVPTVAPTGGASATAEAGSPIPATAAPAATEVPADTPVPDPTPAMLRPAPVTLPDCGDSFRRMLAGYDGPDPFTVDVVNEFNGEFVAQRPDCVALGWGPEFSQDPVVCLTEDDLPGGPSRQVGGTGTFELLPTNMFYRDHFLPDGSESEMVHIFLHLNLVPLRDEVPEHGSLLGSAFGGCWYHKGVGQSGFWHISTIGFVPGEDRLGKLTARGRSKAVGESVYNTFPECDALLQDALSRRVDSGEAVDVAGVLSAVEEVRGQGGPGCAEDMYPWGGWVPSPVDGPSGGCPGSPAAGLQPDGAFIVNWSEWHRDVVSRDYRDSYGWSSCWVREPDGEWGAYLRAGAALSGPVAPVSRAAVSTPTPPAVTQEPLTPLDADRAVLEDFYRATGGNRWSRRQNNWLSDLPPDRWLGVTVSNGRVTELELVSFGLTGEIPREIGSLTGLEILDLSNNDLAGPIPDSLGLLSGLRLLNLGDNQLAGGIPPQLGSLEALENLHLHNNQFTGELPSELTGLSRLAALNVSGNQLTGSFPAEYAALTNLSILQLDDNALSGCIPESIMRGLDFTVGIGLPFCR